MGCRGFRTRNISRVRWDLQLVELHFQRDTLKRTLPCRPGLYLPSRIGVAPVCRMRRLGRRGCWCRCRCRLFLLRFASLTHTDRPPSRLRRGRYFGGLRLLRRVRRVQRWTTRSARWWFPEKVQLSQYTLKKSQTPTIPGRTLLPVRISTSCIEDNQARWRDNQLSLGCDEAEPTVGGHGALLAVSQLHQEACALQSPALC